MRGIDLGFIPKPPIEIEERTVEGTMKEMHCHPWLEIYYLTKGEREYFIEDSFYRVQSGDIVLIPGGVMHRTDGKDVTRILIDLHKEFLYSYFSAEMVEYIANFDSPMQIRPIGRDGERLFSSARNLVRLYQEQESELKGLKIAAEIFEILYFLTVESKMYRVLPCPNGTFENIISYINKNFRDIKAIDDVTGKFFINNSYFSRKFSATLGMPFTTYLNMLKIRHAVSILKSGKRIVLADVAEMCGFNSCAYFCRVFKQKMGVSPKNLVHNGNVDVLSAYRIPHSQVEN